jgi:CRISPR-associated protein Csb2
VNAQASHLVVTLRFLDPVYHGRRAQNEPEWPPAPLRVFQALVAAAAARGRANRTLGAAEPALRWLETLDPPIVIAPRVELATAFRIAVPNNDLDVVASAWARGATPKRQPNELRTMKSVRSIWLRDGDAVHYLWPLASGDQARDYVVALERVARSVVALGWGIDLVVGEAAVISRATIDRISGERWTPGSDGSAADGLRVPVPGTLDALNARHAGALARVDLDGFYRPPPPLSVFGVRRYRTATSPAARPFVAFSILRMDAGGFCAFDPARRGLTVAGMTRHAVRRAAEVGGWPQDRVNAVILGHSRETGAHEHVPVGEHRFAFLPLPSIEWRGEGETVGAIRRLLVTSFSDDLADEMAWIRRSLSGQELIDERTKEPVALLSLLPNDDPTIRRFVAPAATWATVTPVVLPGYDDPSHYRRRLRHGVSADEQRQLLARLDARIDSLLRKAIVHAGFSEVLARHAELEWRDSGFFPGVDLATRYGLPDHLARFPTFHIKIRWRDATHREIALPGPICLGGGRYLGLGLCRPTTAPPIL